MRVLVGAALLAALSFAPAFAAPSQSFRIIVNPENPTASVEKRFLSQAFLKKVTVWPDGELIRPIDLPPASQTRRAFASDVLNRSISAVRNYWQQQLFAGRVLPPPELESEEAVVAYVLKHRGAIGYVSVHADVRSAKALTIE